MGGTRVIFRGLELLWDGAEVWVVLCVMEGVLQAVPTCLGPGTRDSVGGRAPMALQQVSVNRHDQLGGTTLLGDDTSEQELLTNSLVYPKTSKARMSLILDRVRNVFPTYQDRRHGHPEKQECRV